MIHLKRFSNTNRYGYRSFGDKIDALVSFPVNGLDMSSYLPKEKQDGAIYDLFAISNHYGGLGGGHCKFCRSLRKETDGIDTAYAKNKGKWYDYDDSSVSEISEDRIMVRPSLLFTVTDLADPGGVFALLSTTRRSVRSGISP